MLTQLDGTCGSTYCSWMVFLCRESTSDGEPEEDWLASQAHVHTDSECWQ